MFELSHHFDKASQSKLFRNCILASENRQKESHFYGHFVRSNVPLKFFKDLRFIAIFFFKKNKKCSNPEFFISKKYGQRFFKSENFSYEGPLFIELQAGELAISFY